jgi:hypothetical protein
LNNNHKTATAALRKEPPCFFEGIAVGAFVDDKKSGRYLNAPFFTGLTLRQAVEKAEREFDSPYDK